METPVWEVHTLRIPSRTEPLQPPVASCRCRDAGRDRLLFLQLPPSPSVPLHSSSSILVCLPRLPSPNCPPHPAPDAKVTFWGTAPVLSSAFCRANTPRPCLPHDPGRMGGLALHGLPAIATRRWCGCCWSTRQMSTRRGRCHVLVLRHWCRPPLRSDQLFQPSDPF